jgi:hypothetical protein
MALKVQQRRKGRSKPNQIATVKVLGMRPGPVMSASILDISGSGMRLRSKLAAPCGASVEIVINDTVAQGRVCRWLRVTPAMAAGVTDRLWEVSDLVAPFGRAA